MNDEDDDDDDDDDRTNDAENDGQRSVLAIGETLGRKEITDLLRINNRNWFYCSRNTNKM